jgi:hypothetical protein
MAMKCKNFVLIEKRKRKGSGKEYDFPKVVQSWLHKENGGYTPVPGIEECGGKIVATIKANEEPYMGGVSAVLEVTFTCVRCNCFFFPELPTSDKSLSEFITMLLEKVSEEDHAQLMEAAREEERIRRLPIKERMEIFKRRMKG